MTYGNPRDDTKAYIWKRMKESGLDESQVIFDDDNFHSLLPEYQISVIYGGSLDEEFFVRTQLSGELAEWLAEMCHTESEADADHESWTILVTDPQTSDTLYRLDSE